MKSSQIFLSMFFVFGACLHAMEQKPKLKIERTQRKIEGASPQTTTLAPQAIVEQPSISAAAIVTTSKLSIQRPIKGTESAPKQTVIAQQVKQQVATKASTSMSSTTPSKVTIKSSLKTSKQTPKLTPKPSKSLGVLYDASVKGNLEQVIALLDLGVDINQLNARGRSPLRCAVSTSNQEYVQFLLERGADANLPDSDGCTPLDLAVSRITFPYGSDLKIVQLLLGHGANVNLPYRHGHCTPLSVAVCNGYIEIVQLLLDRGTDPNLKNENGRTALHYASISDFKSIVRLLLDKGANPNQGDEKGRTALHSVAKIGCTLMFQLLLDRGANPNLKDYYGKTPLDLVSSEWQAAVLQIINRWQRQKAHQAIAFLAMASHQRLGEHSPASLLPYDGLIQKTIFQYLTQQ